MHVTMTGIDTRTNLESLPRGVEYGVLFTATPEGRHRYPDGGQCHRIVTELHNLEHRVALHVCGRGARKMLLNRSIWQLVSFVKRIQINGRIEPYELDIVCEQYPAHTIITQHNQDNERLLGAAAENHAVLVDASGGRGKSPTEWRRPGTDKAVGFAGGLGPDNIAVEVAKIRQVATGDWWVDMEGKLRDNDDWFDIEKAEEVKANLR